MEKSISTSSQTSKHLIPAIKSSYLTTLIFSQAFYLNDAIHNIILLSKVGKEFIDKNIK